MIAFSFERRLGEKRFHFEGSVPSRGITVLMGESGAGKSTLAKLLTGILPAEAGKLQVNGTVFYESERALNIPPAKRGIGIAYQDHRLFSHLSVKENIFFALSEGGRRSSLDVEELLELFRLTSLLDAYPATLSGGEAQRVSLARALLASENLLILDEPLASLDEALRDELLCYLKRLAKVVSFPMLYITNSSVEAKFFADTLWFCEGGALHRLKAEELKASTLFSRGAL